MKCDSKKRNITKNVMREVKLQACSKRDSNQVNEKYI